VDIVVMVIAQMETETHAVFKYLASHC